MRYRDHKEFYLGKSYHVYNRGNNKQRIFYSIADYDTTAYKKFVSDKKKTAGKLRAELEYLSFD